MFSQRARPDDVADALEVWIRCRADADVGLRMQARRVARTCRVLAAMQAARLIDENWEAAWERARTDASTLLTQGGSVASPDYPVPSEERITLTDLGPHPEDDRVTPILPPAVEDASPVKSGFRDRRLIRFARVGRG